MMTIQSRLIDELQAKRDHVLKEVDIPEDNTPVAFMSPHAST